MSTLKILSRQEVLENLLKAREQTPLKASLVYSSWIGGIVKDPELAVMPLDDHMVHRGDAVFEAMRFGSGGVYLWKSHWNRLKISAEKVGLTLKYSEAEVLKILQFMIKENQQSEGLIRMYLSRGVGSFSVSPYDSKQSEFYIALSPLSLAAPSQYQQGVSLCLAKTYAKEGLLAQVKSCNYLINVLVKKEALDRGFDYGVCKTTENEITESSTENLIVLLPSGELLFPTWSNTLKGTTLVRLMELLKSNKDYRPTQRTMYMEDLLKARALMLVGTTLGVLPVRQFESQTYSDFQPAHELNEILKEDIILGVERGSSEALR